MAMKPNGGATSGIDPTITARELWLETHPLPENKMSSAAAGSRIEEGLGRNSR